MVNKKARRLSNLELASRIADDAHIFMVVFFIGEVLLFQTVFFAVGAIFLKFISIWLNQWEKNENI